MQPVAFMWDAISGEKLQRFKLPKGRKKITAIALSFDGKVVGMADAHYDPYVSFWDTKSGKLILEAKGGFYTIYGIAFPPIPGDYTCCTVGKQHICFWNHEKKSKLIGLYGKFRDQATSHACAAYDQHGTVYTGGCNSKIFVWKNREVCGILDHHGKGGFISAICVSEGLLVSGSRDQTVCVFHLDEGVLMHRFKVESLVRAIDIMNNKMLVGLRSGKILEFYSIDGSKFETLM